MVEIVQEQKVGLQKIIVIRDKNRIIVASVLADIQGDATFYTHDPFNPKFSKEIHEQVESVNNQVRDG